MTRPSPTALGLLALALAVAAPRASAEEPAAAGAHAAAAPAHPPAADAHAAPPAGRAAPAAGHGEKPDVLAADAPLAFWTVVVFGSLLLILGKYAWGPMMKALHDREEHIEHCLLEAERARNEAERILAENRQALAGAADQVRATIEAAKKEAESIAAGIVQKAHAEAEAGRERAERDIVTARDQALSEIYTRTADLAVAVAGKVLSKTLGADDQRRLAEAAMAELPAMADGRRGARA